MTDWYPVTEQHPGPTIQVKALIEVEQRKGVFTTAEVIASRGKAPHADEWVEWRQRVPTLLPAGAVRCWAPQKPEAWKAGLPPPLRTSLAGRYWSSTTAFALVDEATAAELAGEMERDREDARRGLLEETLRKEGLPWWRDADQVRYEPAGQITPRMAEGRVMRAVATCEHGRELSLRYRSFSTILAEISARVADEKYATSDYVPRLKALPRDVEDFDTAMSWFVALNATPLPSPSSRAVWVPNAIQDLLLKRARNIPLSYETIAAERKVTWQAIQGQYDRAIRRVCRIANGLLRNDVDHIEAVRERNRAWKRKPHDPVAIQSAALERLRSDT